MAQPPSYNRGYDFSSFQTNNPDEALPATQLESEFDAIKTTIDAILVNLAILQRDDTALANQIVTPETFSQDALVLAKVSEFGIRGDWATGTVYAINDIVNYNSATYIAVAAHTALLLLSAVIVAIGCYWQMQQSTPPRLPLISLWEQVVRLRLQLHTPITAIRTF